MKTFFLLALLCLINLSANAYHRGRSMLRLRLSDRSLIAVEVDGRYINKGTNSLTLDGLRPGLHRIDVYRTSASRQRQSRIYSGTVRLASGAEHIGVVDVSRRSLRLYSQPLAEVLEVDVQRSNRDEDVYDDDRNPSDYETNRNDRSTPEIEGDRDGYGSYPRGRNQRTPSNMISQSDLNDLRSRVESRITDTDKESLMKSGLESRSASTAQIRVMLSWLAFESTRLSFAKWAYSRVSDAKNYRKLEDVFIFSASKKEFNDAINKR